MRIILASKSPRRKELLGKIFESFEIITADVDENLDANVHPSLGVKLLAERKGEAVAKSVGECALVISSDTLVELDGTPLGKPEDEKDAVRMLKALSGRAHNVHTGVAVHYKGKVFSDTASTAVYFRELTEREINEYVDSKDPMDKAGAYGIQSGGGKFVDRIEGDFDTVVGLSVRLTKLLIEEALKL